MSGSCFGFRANCVKEERVERVVRGDEGFDSVRRAREVSCETRDVRIALAFGLLAEDLVFMLWFGVRRPQLS